jgi:hypothetical protein
MGFGSEPGSVFFYILDVDGTWEVTCLLPSLCPFKLHFFLLSFFAPVLESQPRASTW